MTKILEWLSKLIPQEYKLSVAIKKASTTIGKLAGAALMMGWMGKHVGSNLTPEQVQQVQMIVGAITAGGLEALHDWARVKYPNITKWI